MLKSFLASTIMSAALAIVPTQFAAAQFGCSGPSYGQSYPMSGYGNGYGYMANRPGPSYYPSNPSFGYPGYPSYSSPAYMPPMVQAPYSPPVYQNYNSYYVDPQHHHHNHHHDQHAWHPGHYLLGHR